jgi:hypothetical protein
MLQFSRPAFFLALAVTGWVGARAGEAPAPAATTSAATVAVVDGIVQPRRPVPQAIADAIAFLRKADGDYKPGDIGGDLAGYFVSAHVNADGSRTGRELAFPARQHAYFIFTFLHYHKYSREAEWLTRARDLADWNLARSTPADAAWANLPWSVWTKGRGGGSADKESTEPDKAAWFGSAYLALFEATWDAKYLDAAKKIAATLAAKQNADGSWPFRVIPGSGQVFQEFGGAPVFFVQFFEDMQKHDKQPAYAAARDKALALMIKRNVEAGEWGTYHEDIKDKPPTHLSAEPMCFTAAYLFRNAKEHPEYIAMGRKVLAQVEEKLVHTSGHPAAPAPAVSEQTTFAHIMPGHTARYCLALAELYHASGDGASGDEAAKARALSGINALTWMQNQDGLFATFFQLINERNPGRKRPNWYSQHLYTVCHVLEAMELLPEIADKGK